MIKTLRLYPGNRELLEYPGTYPSMTETFRFGTRVTQSYSGEYPGTYPSMIKTLRFGTRVTESCSGSARVTQSYSREEYPGTYPSMTKTTQDWYPGNPESLWEYPDTYPSIYDQNTQVCYLGDPEIRSTTLLYTLAKT